MVFVALKFKALFSVEAVSTLEIPSGLLKVAIERESLETSTLVFSCAPSSD